MVATNSLPDDNETTTIQVRKATRRRLALRVARHYAKHEQSVTQDDVINIMLDSTEADYGS